MQDVSEDGCGTVLQVDRAKWMLGLFGNLAFSEMALSDLSIFPLCEKGHGLMSLAFRLLQRKVPDPIFHESLGGDYMHFYVQYAQGPVFGSEPDNQELATADRQQPGHQQPGHQQPSS